MSDHKSFAVDLARLRPREKDQSTGAIAQADEAGERHGFHSREPRRRGGRAPSPRTGQIHAKVMPGISGGNRPGSETSRRPAGRSNRGSLGTLQGAGASMSQDEQQHRGGFVPIGELAGTPQARHHFTTLHQVNQLIEASEAEPDIGFMARLLALCSLPRTNPGDRLQFKRVNGPYTLGMIAGLGNKLPYGTLPRLLLAWVCTEAVRTQSRELVLGDSLSEFMRRLGLKLSTAPWHAAFSFDVAAFSLHHAAWAGGGSPLLFETRFDVQERGSGVDGASSEWSTFAHRSSTSPLQTPDSSSFSATGPAPRTPPSDASESRPGLPPGCRPLIGSDLPARDGASRARPAPRYRSVGCRRAAGAGATWPARASPGNSRRSRACATGTDPARRKAFRTAVRSPLPPSRITSTPWERSRPRSTNDRRNGVSTVAFSVSVSTKPSTSPPSS